MKKNFFKTSVLPCMASALMLVSSFMGVTPVMAEDGVSISTMTFDKYLVMDSEANVPNATFSYSVSAGSASDGILAGVDADSVTLTGTSSNTIAFTTGDTTYTGDNSAIKDYDSATEKYAKKTAILDFSGCTFTEAGTYRYVITETGSNQGVTNDASTTRIVDVYVNNDGEPVEEGHVICGGCGVDFGAGEAATEVWADHAMEDFFDNCENYTVKSVTVYSTSISGFVLYDGSTKSSGFTNAYDTSNLTVRKEVSGNQASFNAYFPVTVNITNAVAGTVYDVDLSGASASADGNTNPAQLTVGSNGTISQTFYLKHGQEITINGIAKNSKYSVTEDAGDYTSTAAGISGYTGAVSGTIASADIKTSYLNTKEGVVPTGIVMNVAPFAAVTLLGGVGIVTMAMKRKSEDDEEE